jgi:electron transport complex protein RnfB
MQNKNKYQSRRDFVKTVGKWSVALPVGYLFGVLIQKTSANEYVWQIDPNKCTQCGLCETNCVLTVSAVKCMHAYEMCGYCDLCSGYLRQGVKERNTGAELQLCPTSAITRSFVEDPYFSYTINEDLCNACGKCVKGCADFGNGSLYLQIKHELCTNCNHCAIAQTCPADAIQRIPLANPYLLKTGYKTDIR